MQVILMEKLPNVGDLGEVVKVKPGFARNFLIPQGKAKRATPENLKLLEGKRAELEKAAAERAATAQESPGAQGRKGDDPHARRSAQARRRISADGGAAHRCLGAHQRDGGGRYDGRPRLIEAANARKKGAGDGLFFHRPC